MPPPFSLSLSVCHFLPPVRAAPVLLLVRQMVATESSSEPFSLSNCLQTDSTERTAATGSPPAAPRHPRVLFTHASESIAAPSKPPSPARFSQEDPGGTMQLYVAVILAYGVSGKFSNFSVSTNLQSLWSLFWKSVKSALTSEEHQYSKRER